jgi:hypothetical protein
LRRGTKKKKKKKEMKFKTERAKLETNEQMKSTKHWNRRETSVNRGDLRAGS